MTTTTRIGVFVFPQAEELDFVGPWEVLAAWAQKWPDDGIETLTVARDEGPIRCAKGLVVIPDHSFDSVPKLDVLVYPGGQGTRPQLDDEGIVGWVRGLAESGVLIASVCTGSLVLARAGLLDGRAATTHWGSVDRLAELGRDIEVRPDARYVDEGPVITAAGVSAGIDMALHLVRRLHSEARAREVRRYIQYDPDPPV